MTALNDLNNAIENLPSTARAAYDHERFPKKSQGILCAALLQPAATVVIVLLMLLLGEDYASHFRTPFGADMFSAILSELGLILPICLIVLTVSKKDIVSTLRLSKSIDIAQILLLVFLCLFGFYSAQIINASFITGLEDVFGKAADINDQFSPGNIGQLLFQIVVVGGLPAICEEILCRGIVLRSFERSSRVSAVIFSALVFSLMHGNAQQFLYAFICGIALGAVAVISDSIYASITMHFTLNSMATLLTYEPIQVAFEQFTTRVPLVFGLLLIVFDILTVVCFFLFLKYTQQKNVRLYGKKVPSDMAYPKLMPKQEIPDKIVYAISWIIFVSLNIFSAVGLWKGIA